MALIKLHNNLQGVGSTPACSNTIVDIDVPVEISHPGGFALPDFRVLVTTSAGASQPCDIRVQGAPGTDEEIYDSLNAAVEAAVADPYAIPVVSGITDTTGAEKPITVVIV